MIDTKRHDEICQRLDDLDVLDQRKELVIAIYTLIYTAIGLNEMVKNEQLKYLSYYILLSDYIYSYCTEIIYQNNELKLLKTFATHSKKLLLDVLDGNDTDYFIELIVSNL
jgi:hypothetical protein